MWMILLNYSSTHCTAVHSKINTIYQGDFILDQSFLSMFRSLFLDLSIHISALRNYEI